MNYELSKLRGEGLRMECMHFSFEYEGTVPHRKWDCRAREVARTAERTD